jgi:hypothetical protein
MRTVAGRAMLVATVTAACAGGVAASRTVISVPSPAHDAVAFVTESPSFDPPNQTLRVGFDGSGPVEIEHLGRFTHAFSRIAWSPDGRAVLFVVNGNRGPDFGVVVWRPATPGDRPKTGHVDLHEVASAARVAIDQDGRANVPIADLRPDFPLWLPAAVSGDVGFYSDGSYDLKLRFASDASAELVTESLRAHFRRAGWSEQAHEVLNPTMATSFASGWRPLGGGVIPPGYSHLLPPMVRRWTGEWRRGDELVRYSLMHVDDRLTGYASYSPPYITRIHEEVGRRNAAGR